MSPRRLTPCHLALALLICGVLGAFWPPLAGIAGVTILLGLIIGLGVLAVFLVRLFQRS